MNKHLVKYCSKCGYRINPEEDRFCPCCGKPIIRQEEETPLSEEDVKDIPIIEKSPIDELKEKKGKPKSKDPWLSGSYYIGVVAIIITLFLVAARVVNFVFLPCVILIVLLGISLFGAFQMRLDKAHEGIIFPKLMFLSLKEFMSIHSAVDKPDKPDKPITK